MYARFRSDKLLDNYTNGIFKDCGTDTNILGAMLVGIGEENGEKYLKFRGTRGAGWGEAGYFRLLRGANACSINDYPLLYLKH